MVCLSLVFVLVLFLIIVCYRHSASSDVAEADDEEEHDDAHYGAEYSPDLASRESGMMVGCHGKRHSGGGAFCGGGLDCAEGYGCDDCCGRADEGLGEDVEVELAGLEEGGWCWGGGLRDVHLGVWGFVFIRMCLFVMMLEREVWMQSRRDGNGIVLGEL